LHNIDESDIEPKGEFDIVIYGHSHMPLNETRDGVLYFNPGSAGPRRFKLPIAAGKIDIEEGKVKSEIREFG
jgi:predicted phosphodiesterase